MELRERYISEAWPIVIKRILELGDPQEVIVDAEYVWTMEYPEPIIVRLSDPLVNMIPEGSKWKKTTLDMYAKQLLDSNKHDFVYTYGERLRDYRVPVAFEGLGIDQIENIIKKLTIDPLSRQAVAVTWKPWEDPQNEYPPCLQLIDVKIRKGKLNLTAYIRSNDIFSAWPQNAYALTMLLKYLAESLNTKPGILTIVSNAAHIYEYDFRDACKLTGLDYNSLVDMINRL